MGDYLRTRIACNMSAVALEKPSLLIFIKMSQIWKKLKDYYYNLGAGSCVVE